MASKTLTQHPYLDDSLVIEEAPSVSAEREAVRRRRLLDWRQALGGLSIAAGLVMLVGGWIGMSGTTQLSAQLTYLFSGGFGGAGLIALGTTFLVAFQHHADRMAIGELDGKLVALQSEIRSLAAESATAREPLGKRS